MPSVAVGIQIVASDHLLKGHNMTNKDYEEWLEVQKRETPKWIHLLILAAAGTFLASIAYAIYTCVCRT